MCGMRRKGNGTEQAALRGGLFRELLPATVNR